MIEEVAHNNHPSTALLMKSFGTRAHDICSTGTSIRHHADSFVIFFFI
jgi:hypothetical protein